MLTSGDPALDQLNMARRHEFTVNAKIVSVHQEKTSGLGDGANPHLHGVTVADEAGSKLPDHLKRPPLFFWRGSSPYREGFGLFHQVVDLRDVDPVITMRADKSGIDLSDKHLGILSHVLVVPEGVAEAAITLLIRGRHHAEEDVRLPGIGAAVF